MIDPPPHPDGPGLDRRAVVARLVRDRGEMLAVSSLGSATYDLAAAGDHPRNFYLWGAMGGALALGLGLALAQPAVPVLVLAGDGEALMGMGSFATIAVQRPANLSVVILDNRLYGETGSQHSHTAWGVDLAAIAAGCGIAETGTVADAAALETLAARVVRPANGPSVTVVRIGGEEMPRCLPVRDGTWLKTRLRESLGFQPL